MSALRVLIWLAWIALPVVIGALVVLSALHALKMGESLIVLLVFLVCWVPTVIVLYGLRWVFGRRPPGFEAAAQPPRPEDR
jgi:hypothetical protein